MRREDWAKNERQKKDMEFMNLSYIIDGNFGISENTVIISWMCIFKSFQRHSKDWKEMALLGTTLVIRIRVLFAPSGESELLHGIEKGCFH